jgi:hypothetical protein
MAIIAEGLRLNVLLFLVNEMAHMGRLAGLELAIRGPYEGNKLSAEKACAKCFRYLCRLFGDFCCGSCLPRVQSYRFDRNTW